MVSLYVERIDKFIEKFARTVENAGKNGIVEKGNITIPKQKLTGYALDPKNAPDKAKAFELALGCNADNADDLLQKIIDDSVDESKLVEMGNNGYGTLYECVIRLA